MIGFIGKLLFSSLILVPVIKELIFISGLQNGNIRKMCLFLYLKHRNIENFIFLRDAMSKRVPKVAKEDGFHVQPMDI